MAQTGTRIPGESSGPGSQSNTFESRITYLESTLTEHQTLDFRHLDGVGYKTNAYDALGNLVEEIRYSNRNKTAIWSKRNKEYNAAGDITKEIYSIYRNGKAEVTYTTVFEYDGAGVCTVEETLTTLGG